MKSIDKILLVLIMLTGVAGIFIACDKNNDDSGTPSVNYVRITRPESSDSLLVGAGQGRLIAIVGENLKDAVEVWFNDRQAVLTPTYITDKTILVSVPNPIPTDITNKMKIVFKNGFILYHDFVVQISAPYIASMVSEFVNDGDVAAIRGDFFYEPLTVKFEGGAAGQIVSVTETEIRVKVPTGAQAGR